MIKQDLITFFKNIIKKIFLIFNLRISRTTRFEEYPIEAEDNIKKFINLSNQYSMTGKKRMYILWQAVFNAKIKNLNGEFVECGVWRGGNVLLFKLLNDYYNLNKSIFAYDTYDGMTQPENIDINFEGNSAKNLMKINSKNDKLDNIHCFTTIEEVKKNISKHTSLKNINFIKGPVESTLLEEKNLPKNIAVLRLDTDFYSSTKIELNILYPRLVSGGVIIIDDYGYWAGSRRAVDEYFSEKDWLHIVDDDCRYIIKN